MPEHAKKIAQAMLTDTFDITMENARARAAHLVPSSNVAETMRKSHSIKSKPHASDPSPDPVDTPR